MRYFSYIVLFTKRLDRRQLKGKQTGINIQQSNDLRRDKPIEKKKYVFLLLLRIILNHEK